MEYRTLGTSDLQLSAITYGAFAIGGNMWGATRRKTPSMPCKPPSNTG